MPELDAQHRAQLAEIIGEHAADMSDEQKIDGAWTWGLCCDCGDFVPGGDLDKHIADRVAPLVAEWLADARASAIRNPYDEDGYCEFCGNHCGKPHSPTCGWTDLRDAKADAWDEGWDAASEVVELDGQRAWLHTVMPEGCEGNPYRGGDS